MERGRPRPHLPVVRLSSLFIIGQIQGEVAHSQGPSVSTTPHSTRCAKARETSGSAKHMPKACKWRVTDRWWGSRRGTRGVF